ncbi:PilZ domain-containing protein [Qipengyuania sp. DSG2-2]|uniref:PilZ domain-containing protein n=1 Tax=Qipengyuania sp. DGS2-2 TaxID=3349631 RepID=UPI0036D265D6
MRSYNRLSLDKEIACRVDGVREYVTLYNVSSGGCMIECVGDMAEGSRVDLDLNDVTPMRGSVVWRIEKNAGIKFDVPLHTAVVESLGYAAMDEEFDRHDPRDRFGIPLVGTLHKAAGNMG